MADIQERLIFSSSVKVSARFFSRFKALNKAIACFLGFQTDRICMVLKLGGLVMVLIVYEFMVIGLSLYLNYFSAGQDFDFKYFQPFPIKEGDRVLVFEGSLYKLDKKKKHKVKPHQKFAIR